MIYPKPKDWKSALVLTGCFCLINAGSAWAQAADPLPPHDEPLPIPISFSVDRGAEGLLSPVPNDVFDVGSMGLLTEGEIFQSSGRALGAPPDETNVYRLSGALGCLPRVGPAPCISSPPGVFGLVPSDNIISLSYGMDSGSVLQFSVDPTAIGMPGYDVHFESTLSPAPFGDPGNEAAGDIYKSQRFGAFGSYIPDHIAAGHILDPASDWHDLYRDEQELGLQAPAGAGDTSPEDDLDAFEEADTGDPFWGVDSIINATGAPGIDGIVDPEKFAFFSLDEVSPSLGGPVSSDDILVATAPDPDFGFDIFADGVLNIGLMAGDVLDALALSDIGNVSGGSSGHAPNGFLDIGEDEALFSLALGSPTLAALGLSAADVFYTDFSGSFRLYARHDQLGLRFGDELNALDIKARTPEPGTLIGLALLGVGGLFGATRKKR